MDIFTRNAALILWWNLFESILEKYLKATGKLSPSTPARVGRVDDLLEQALLTLLNLPATNLETWETTIPLKAGRSRLKQTLGKALTSVAQKALAHTRDNVAAFKMGGFQREPTTPPFTLYPKLLVLCRSFGVLGQPSGNQSGSGFDEHALYSTLEAAAAQVLDDAYQTARGMEKAARVTESLTSSSPQAQEPEGALAAALSALNRLPAPLLIQLATVLNWMYDFAADDPDSSKSLLAFLQSNQQLFNALLHLRVGEFEGVHDLGFLLIRPFTFLWPFETKERLLLTPNLCIPATRNSIVSYQVQVKRDNLLTDAFGAISEIDAQAVRQFGIDVAFDQEEGHGPGVMREFLTLVSDEQGSRYPDVVVCLCTLLRDLRFTIHEYRYVSYASKVSRIYYGWNVFQKSSLHLERMVNGTSRRRGLQAEYLAQFPRLVLFAARLLTVLVPSVRL